MGPRINSLSHEDREALIDGLAHSLEIRAVAPQEVMSFPHLTTREKVALLASPLLLTEQGKKDLTRGITKKMRELTEGKPHTFSLSLNQHAKKSIKTLEAYADDELSTQQLTRYCKNEDIIPFNSPDMSSDDVVALSIEMFRVIQSEQAMVDLEIYQEEGVALDGAAQSAGDVFMHSLLDTIMDVHNAHRH